MLYLYGEFQNYQISNYKKKLHKDLFWLILYKDPNTKEEYQNVDFDKYFSFLMKKIDGLNELLFYPSELIEMLSCLEAAFIETRKEKFNWSVYRKLILDAQSLVDKIGGEYDNNTNV